MLVKEFRLAEFHPGAEGAEAFDRIMLLDDIDDRANAPGNRPEVNGLDLNRRQAESCCVLHLVVGPRGPDQGFAGNAAIVEAVAAKGLLLFHQQRLGAQLGCTGTDGQPGGASPNHPEVKIIACHCPRPLLQERACRFFC